LDRLLAQVRQSESKNAFIRPYEALEGKSLDHICR